MDRENLPKNSTQPAPDEYQETNRSLLESSRPEKRQKTINSSTNRSRETRNLKLATITSADKRLNENDLARHREHQDALPHAPFKSVASEIQSNLTPKENDQNKYLDRLNQIERALEERSIFTVVHNDTLTSPTPLNEQSRRVFLKAVGRHLLDVLGPRFKSTILKNMDLYRESKLFLLGRYFYTSYSNYRVFCLMFVLAVLHVFLYFLVISYSDNSSSEVGNARLVKEKSTLVGTLGGLGAAHTVLVFVDFLSGLEAQKRIPDEETGLMRNLKKSNHPRPPSPPIATPSKRSITSRQRNSSQSSQNTQKTQKSENFENKSILQKIKYFLLLRDSVAAVAFKIPIVTIYDGITFILDFAKFFTFALSFAFSFQLAFLFPLLAAIQKGVVFFLFGKNFRCSYSNYLNTAFDVVLTLTAFMTGRRSPTLGIGLGVLPFFSLLTVLLVISIIFNFLEIGKVMEAALIIGSFLWVCLSIALMIYYDPVSEESRVRGRRAALIVLPLLILTSIITIGVVLFEQRWFAALKKEKKRSIKRRVLRSKNSKVLRRGSFERRRKSSMKVGGKFSISSYKSKSFRDILKKKRGQDGLEDGVRGGMRAPGDSEEGLENGVNLRNRNNEIYENNGGPVKIRRARTSEHLPDNLSDQRRRLDQIEEGGVDGNGPQTVNTEKLNRSDKKETRGRNLAEVSLDGRFNHASPCLDELDAEEVESHDLKTTTFQVIQNNENLAQINRELRERHRGNSGVRINAEKLEESHPASQNSPKKRKLEIKDFEGYEADSDHQEGIISLKKAEGLSSHQNKTEKFNEIEKKSKIGLRQKPADSRLKQTPTLQTKKIELKINQKKLDLGNPEYFQGLSARLKKIDERLKKLDDSSDDSPERYRYEPNNDNERARVSPHPFGQFLEQSPSEKLVMQHFFEKDDFELDDGAKEFSRSGSKHVNSLNPHKSPLKTKLSTKKSKNREIRDSAKKAKIEGNGGSGVNNGKEMGKGEYKSPLKNNSRIKPRRIGSLIKVKTKTVSKAESFKERQNPPKTDKGQPKGPLKTSQHPNQPKIITTPSKNSLNTNKRSQKPIERKITIKKRKLDKSWQSNQPRSPFSKRLNRRLGDRIENIYSEQEMRRDRRDPDSPSPMNRDSEMCDCESQANEGDVKVNYASEYALKGVLEGRNRRGSGADGVSKSRAGDYRSIAFKTKKA